ncbi:MAG: transposase [Chloroflexi bacterium]|nr:MAG: transposase [Chloroflexota bacterium]
MPIIPDPPLSAYTPHFHTGLVFVTLTGVRGERIFRRAETANLLRSVLREVRQKLGFAMHAWVILPDHSHLLLQPGAEGGGDEIVRRVRRRYAIDYAQLMGSPAEMVVWESHYGLESVSDEAEFARRIDTVHYDPVRHGLVTRPEEWVQSSYSAWVERGLYKLGWGWSEPERLVRPK